jgi:hypothetical protein
LEDELGEILGRSRGRRLDEQELGAADTSEWITQPISVELGQAPEGDLELRLGADDSLEIWSDVATRPQEEDLI